MSAPERASSRQCVLAAGEDRLGWLTHAREVALRRQLQEARELSRDLGVVRRIGTVETGGGLQP